MLNGLRVLCLFLLAIGVISCGGGSGGSESSNEPAKKKLVIITSDNQELVKAFATFVPESMLQVSQFSSSWMQTLSSNIEQQAPLCESTNFSREFQDFDDSANLSAGDKIEFQLTNCLIPELMSEVTGDITINIKNVSDDNYSIVVETDFTVIDGQDSMDFDGSLIVDFSTTPLGHKIALSNDQPLVLTIEGSLEKISDFTLNKTVDTEKGDFSIKSKFTVTSKALDGEFSCADSTNMTGLLFDLPSSFNFRCSGDKNSYLNVYSTPNSNIDAMYSYGEDDITINKVHLWEGSIGMPVIIPDAAKNFEVLTATHEFNHLMQRNIFVDKQRQLLYLYRGDTIQQFDMSSMSLKYETNIEQDYQIKQFTLDATGNPRLFISSSFKRLDNAQVIELDKNSLSVINSYILSELILPLGEMSGSADVYNLTSSPSEPNKWGVLLTDNYTERKGQFVEVNNGLVVKQWAVDIADWFGEKRLHYIDDDTLLYLEGLDSYPIEVKTSILKKEQDLLNIDVTNTFTNQDTSSAIDIQYDIEYHDSKFIILKGGYILNRQDLSLKFNTSATAYLDGFNWLLKGGQRYEYYDITTGLLNRRATIDALNDEYWGYNLVSAGKNYVLAYSNTTLAKIGIGHFVFAR